MPELRRQSEDFTAAVRADNRPASLTVVPGHGHFSLLDELADADGRLARELVRLIEKGAD